MTLSGTIRLEELVILMPHALRKQLVDDCESVTHLGKVQKGDDTRNNHTKPVRRKALACRIKFPSTRVKRQKHKEVEQDREEEEDEENEEAEDEKDKEEQDGVEPDNESSAATVESICYC